jgi:hypothetical protein
MELPEDPKIRTGVEMLIEATVDSLAITTQQPKVEKEIYSQWYKEAATDEDYVKRVADHYGVDLNAPIATVTDAEYDQRVADYFNIDLKPL